MQIRSLTFLKTLAASAAIGLTPITGAADAQTSAAEPVPIDYFAVLDTMTNVGLSPDGKYISYLRMPSKDGKYVAEIRRVDDLGAKPIRLGAAHMEIQGASWISNDALWVTFRQKIRDKVEGQNDGVWAGDQAIARIDRNGKVKFDKLPYDDFSLESRLLKLDPENILVTTGKFRRRGQNRGLALSEAFTPDYYKMNIKTKRLKLFAKVGSRVSGFTLDRDGDIRFGTQFDTATRDVVFFTRPKGENAEWKEVTRWNYLEEENGIQPIGFDPQNLNKAFVLAYNGHDKRGVYLMDVNTGELEEEIYRRSDADMRGGWFSSDPNKPDHVAGFYYYLDGVRKIAWIDREEKALFDGLQAALPGKEISIGSRSFDRTKMLVISQSGKDPGTYYLYNDGAIQAIGSRNPLLKPDDLGEVSFITWTARDGKTIPGYLTTPPKGEAPYPLIVMPHGGPEVPEHVVYDEWAQVLANNGYMVLQPGFRGTTGYGLEHAAGIFNKWGKEPQDDKDDGALHLIREGLVDPERVAMFGWSYGGYAAMTASQRTPQIYQCAIAGAGVSDPDLFSSGFSGSRITRAQLKARRSDGYSPFHNTEKTNIPILVIHGALDERVHLEHSDIFVDGLKKNGKYHKYVVLKDSDHFINRIPYADYKIYFSEMINYLREDCGPGGL